ncbi:hypothetical protein BpHYR1_051752 [Brachionus plicatilis]|uniref:Uncharacterized protein n=1 Tax=Brachionus plicatilis TaxID=10195 RepID=A0A3M7PAD4_BRAPC|nr:hypothetical protein BpHYR1_051752 [Brachionus plicatilis]
MNLYPFISSEVNQREYLKHLSDITEEQLNQFQIKFRFGNVKFKNKKYNLQFSVKCIPSENFRFKYSKKCREKNYYKRSIVFKKKTQMPKALSILLKNDLNSLEISFNLLISFRLVI